MNGGSTVKTNISFLNMSAQDMADEAVQGILRTAGEEGKILMRKNMKHKDYTGNTRKSVMWATKQDGSVKPETDDVLDLPATRDRVIIGSAAPNSTFIEYGTLGHINKIGSAEFVREVTKWAMSKGIPEDRIGAIIGHIRKNGTAAFPYAQQTRSDLEDLASRMCWEFGAKFAQKLNYKKGNMTNAWGMEASE